MSPVLDHEREEIRNALLSISVQHHGVLNPHDVVDIARDPSHVLHARFEWDDSAAAEAYRLAQASALIRRVRLTVMRASSTNREITMSTTRAYQSRPSMRPNGYEAIQVLLADDEKRRELLAQVLSELNAYRKRYAELSELEAVWIAVDEAMTDLHAESPDGTPSTAPDGETRPGAAG